MFFIKKTLLMSFVLSQCVLCIQAKSITGTLTFRTVQSTVVSEVRSVEFNNRDLNLGKPCDMRLEYQKIEQGQQISKDTIKVNTKLCKKSNRARPGMYMISGLANGSVRIRLKGIDSSSMQYAPSGKYIPLGLNDKAVTEINQAQELTSNKEAASVLSGTGQGMIYIGGDMRLKEQKSLSSTAEEHFIIEVIF